MYAFTYHRPTSLAALKGLLGSEELASWLAARRCCRR